MVAAAEIHRSSKPPGKVGRVTTATTPGFETPAQVEATARLAAPVSERVEIEAIRQVEGQFKLKEFGVIASPEVELMIRGNATHDPVLDRVRASVQFNLRARLQVETDAGNDLFTITAAYLLLYKLESSEGLSQEHYDAFGRLNGLFNAWPYWREFVQTTTARMGLPSITIPVLHVLGRKAETNATLLSDVQQCSRRPA